MKKTKKIIIVIVIGLILCAVGYAILVFLNRPVINSTLSTRTQEYIKKQKLKNNDRWGMVQTEPQEKKVEVATKQSDTAVTTECFSFQIPYPIMRDKDLEKCNKYITFETPRGYITAYQTEAPSGSLDDNPGILLRRRKPEQYSESIVNVNDRTYVIYIDKTEGHAETAFHQANGKLFVLNLMGYVAEDLNSQFINILKTVSFKK